MQKRMQLASSPGYSLRMLSQRTVSLQDFALFPVDTLFQAADGGVVYGEGADAV
jgi:hypothetical protein